MSLNTQIDQIDTLLTNGAPLSQIKPLLMSLREHAEALDSRVRLLEAEAQTLVPESAYREVVADRDEIAKDRDYFRAELGKRSDPQIEYPEEEKILAHIAHSGSKEAEELSEPLGLSKIKAEFYCERLEGIGYLSRAAMWIDRRPFHLTQKAKEYLIKKGLAG